MHEAADEIERLKARIAKLEGLGPLIIRYGMQREFFGRHDDMQNLHLANETAAQIDAILKGES